MYVDCLRIPFAKLQHQKLKHTKMKYLSKVRLELWFNAYTCMLCITTCVCLVQNVCTCIVEYWLQFFVITLGACRLD